jgi:hypothetical protein
MTSAPPQFSWGIFGGLLLVLGASSMMFTLLTRRSTRLRSWVVMSEWAGDRGFSLRRGHRAAALPAVLGRLHGQALLTLRSPRTLFCKVQVPNPPDAASDAGAAPEGTICHLLVHKISADWQPAALRAVNAPAGLVDRYGLRPFHSFAAEDRFVVLASDALAAKHLWRSGAPAALPTDLALLLWHDRLVIDFSARHFDPIEFDRMLALAQQIARAI